MDLLNSQKKELFDLINQRKLSPYNFDWESKKKDFAQGIPVLAYTNTSYFFSFNLRGFSGYENTNGCRYSPGPEDLVLSRQFDEWPEQTLYFAEWLVCLEKELSIPDPWEQLKNFVPKNDLMIYKGDPQQGFSYNEVESVCKELTDYKKYLITQFKLDANQTKLLSEKIDYLCEQSKVQLKDSWVYMFVGVLASLFLVFAFSPDQALQAWTIAEIYYKNIFFGKITF